VNPLSSSVDPGDLADHFSGIQLSDLSGKSMSDLNPALTYREEIQYNICNKNINIYTLQMNYNNKIIDDIIKMTF